MKLRARLRWLITPAVFVPLWTCSKQTVTGPTNWTVQYLITVDANISPDSVTYDNGHGTFVKVSAPSSTWTAAFAVASPGTIAGTAWFTAIGAGAAQLKVTWTPTAGGTGYRDSTRTTTSGAGKLSVTLPNHSL